MVQMVFTVYVQIRYVSKLLEQVTGTVRHSNMRNFLEKKNIEALEQQTDVARQI